MKMELTKIHGVFSPAMQRKLESHGFALVGYSPEYRQGNALSYSRRGDHRDLIKHLVATKYIADRIERMDYYPDARIISRFEMWYRNGFGPYRHERGCAWMRLVTHRSLQRYVETSCR